MAIGELRSTAAALGGRRAAPGRGRGAGEGGGQRAVPLGRRPHGRRARGAALPGLAAAVHPRPRDRRLGGGKRARGERLFARSAGGAGGHPLRRHVRLLPARRRQQLRRRQRRARLRSRRRTCPVRAARQCAAADRAQDARSAQRRAARGCRRHLVPCRAARAAATQRRSDRDRHRRRRPRQLCGAVPAPPEWRARHRGGCEPGAAGVRAPPRRARVRAGRGRGYGLRRSSS